MREIDTFTDALLEQHSFPMVGQVTLPSGAIKVLDMAPVGYFTPCRVVLRGMDKNDKPIFDAYSHGSKPCLMARGVQYGAELR